LGCYYNIIIITRIINNIEHIIVNLIIKNNMIAASITNTIIPATNTHVFAIRFPAFSRFARLPNSRPSVAAFVGRA